VVLNQERGQGSSQGGMTSPPPLRRHCGTATMNNPIPSRLARLAQTSQNRAHTRRRVLHLYREWYRGAPEIVSMYALDLPPSVIRHTIREKFEHNRHVDDLQVIDRLIHQSRSDYQEALNGWLPSTHVRSVFLQSKHREPKTFLQKFFEGRDGDQVLAGPPEFR